jgi:hypothetical protein
MQYLTNTSELTSVADAIREKGGTSAPLTYPFGWVSAIQDIQTGGDIDALIDGTLSGTYENSTATYVRSMAFQGCDRLQSVVFLSCSSIGYSAFQYCSSLTTASFPACTFISQEAF